MQNLTEVTILNKYKINETVFVIDFERTFEFKPGQIIGVTNILSLAPRLYSICSPPAEQFVSILFNVNPGGELTPPLAQVKNGDKVLVTQAHGKFIYNNEPAWWIATGTGIAPFVSMFKSGQRPLKIIQGGRQKTDIYFSNIFEKHNNYTPCCSQDRGDGVFEGRLTKYLSELNEIPTNINYYLCGSAEMVVDVRELLIAKGVPFNNIITEIYF